jgi:hypothetical protein
MAPNIVAGGFRHIDLLRDLSEGLPTKSNNCTSATVDLKASCRHDWGVYSTIEVFVYMLWGGDARMRPSVRKLLSAASNSRFSHLRELAGRAADPGHTLVLPVMLALGGMA